MTAQVWSPPAFTLATSVSTLPEAAKQGGVAPVAQTSTETFQPATPPPPLPSWPSLVKPQHLRLPVFNSAQP
jgi:hypothetical protein